MTSLAAQIFEYNIDVAAADIDELGHVNNAVYLKWVQEAVLSHWRALASREDVASHLWVALKHEISYLHPAFLNDHIEIDVVLKKLFGARAFYKTVIHRDNVPIAVVESCWCCLDSVSRKPVRLAKDIAARFFPAKLPLWPKG